MARQGGTAGQAGLTAQVTAEHEVEHEEAMLIVLERVAQVNDERVVDLERRRTACAE